MSERMIELQRAKMGLPPMTATGTSTGTPTQVKAPGAATLTNARTPNSIAVAARTTPQQAAAAAMFAEEEQLQGFLQKLQDRDSNKSSEETSGATVPSALSRRVMQRQGVGYLDETVAAIASVSADRFLATVLQQAAACRDQRLKGAELAREETKKRRRHIQQYQEDADGRHRRKVAREEARRKVNLAAIETAKNLGKTGAVANATSSCKSKKKKKKTDAPVGENGNKKPDPVGKNDEADDESSQDSLDEEEEYYEDFFGEENGDEDGVNTENVEEDEEEEEDDTGDTLLLRDLVRPLEAWEVHLTGKLGVGASPVASSDGEASDEGQGDEPSNDEQTKDVTGEPSSPSAAKAPATSGKGEKKVAETAGNGASANRTSTPAPTANSSSPALKAKPKPS